MPSLVTWAIASIGASLGGTFGAILIMNAGAIAAGAILIGGLALSLSQASKAKRKARDAFNAAQVDRLVNTTSTIAPRELVMGRVRKGGAVFFKASTGADKTTFVMCVALAGHEIDAVEAVYFNDELVTLDGSGNVASAPYALNETINATALGTGSAQTLAHSPITSTIRAFTGSTYGREGDIAEVSITGSGTTWTTTAGATIQYQYTDGGSNANVRAILGTTGQAADARIIALFPGLWTAAHRARAVAYLICEFTYSESSFPTGLPIVTAVVRGAKIYDPRTTGTVWSENPALMMRHVYQHPRFGKATITAAEDVRITTAADACDVSTGYSVAGVTDTQTLYRAGIVAAFGASAKDLFDDLAQSMGGSWAFAGGGLYIKAGTFTSSVMSLTDADLAVVVRAGLAEQMIPINIAVHRERASLFNVVNVQIWDSFQGYKKVSLTPLKGAALIARDGAELAQAVTFAAIGYAPQALHAAGVMMRDARDPLTVEIPFKLRAYPIELFDTIDLTLARYGWTSKLFEVRGRSWTADGNLQLTLKETSATIYAVDAGFPAQGYADNTGLPSPWFVPLVGTLTITSGTSEVVKQADGTVISRMRVTWPAITDASITQNGSVEVQYRSAINAAEWLSVQVDGNSTQLVASDVQDGAIYIVRARARNRIAVGLWNTHVVHQVIGKTDLEAVINSAGFAAEQTGIRVTWAAVTNPDLAGYEIRVGGSDWATSALVANVAGSLEYLWPPQLAGSYTVRVKARDTSGNYSASEAVTVIVVAAPGTPTISSSPTSPGSVTLHFTDATATNSLRSVEFRYGDSEDTFDTATLASIVAGSARSVSLLFSTGANYRIFYRATDVAGNVGFAGYTDVTIASPAFADGPDLTPPPTATGLAVTPGLSYLYVASDAQVYTQGHGHNSTAVYGAKWPADTAAPVFSAAVKLFDFQGLFGAYPSDTGTRWAIWIKWRSHDGVLSTSPAGGTNGVQATTGKIGNVDLGELIVEAGNLADGIEPITIVTGAVPATKSTSTIFRTDDGKLYRWNGSAYVVSIPSTDITGTLTDAQLAAVSAAKITGQITSTQITDSSITTAKISAGAVVAASISAGAITSAKLAAGAVTAGKITAGAIVASDISAGAITTAKLAAGAVTANELAADSVIAGKIQAGSITATKLAANSIAVGTAAIQNGAIVNAMIGNATIDSAKIASLSAAQLTAGDGTIGGNLKSSNFVSNVSGWLLTPAGFLEAQNAVLRGTVYASAGLIGGVTIAAAGVQAGQTAYDTGAGFYLGADGTFSIGNSAGNKLTWNGSSLQIRGEINIGAYTGWAWPPAGGYGVHLGENGLLMGNANNGRYVEVTSTGNIFTPGFSIVSGVMTINQANVINSANIANNAVTVSNSSSGTNSTSTNIDVPSGVTARLFAIGSKSSSTEYPSSFTAVGSLNITINGYTKSYSVRTITYSVDSGPNETNYYTYFPPVSGAHEISVAGPATVTATASFTGGLSNPITLIFFARFK